MAMLVDRAWRQIISRPRRVQTFLSEFEPSTIVATAGEFIVTMGFSGKTCRMSRNPGSAFALRRGRLAT
jgi:hypothetical protein